MADCENGKQNNINREGLIKAWEDLQATPIGQHIRAYAEHQRRVGSPALTKKTVRNDDKSSLLMGWCMPPLLMQQRVTPSQGGTNPLEILAMLCM